MASGLSRSLHQLARLYRVETAYYDIFGQVRRPPPEGLLHILKALGAPLDRLEDTPDALKARRQALWRRGLEPVVVAWEGRLPEIKLRLPSDHAEREVYYEIQLEDGGAVEGRMPSSPLRAAREVEGKPYVAARLQLRQSISPGYHRLQLKVGRKKFESLLIAAPARMYGPPPGTEKLWGVFVPLYGLHSKSSWGAGNFSDLEKLAQWVYGLGGHTVATLPLLPAFLDEPFDPSPYSPVSRLYWNEFYVDPTRVPEFPQCPGAVKLIDSTRFQEELSAARASNLVDYRRQMRMRREVIEELRGCLSEHSRAEFLRFIESHAAVDDYARFRALTESRRQTWWSWPRAARDGKIQAGEYEEASRQYHLFAQWLADRQMRSLGEKTRSGGGGLYLDFPLGVHPDGYDVWRHRAAFALESSGGAPPDTFFTKGQDWGFPPLHPEGLRATGYRYYIDALRHHLKHAAFLRIDHVMGLHRLFWVPRGLGPAEGTYVHCHPEELYAILSLESHRYRTRVIGENLGTVPPYVNTAMARHGVRGMYVGQFVVNPDPDRALEDPSPDVVASLNTHDTPTFAAFWKGLDIDDRKELGLVDESQSRQQHEHRARLRHALSVYLKNRGFLARESEDPGAVLEAWLAHLAAGPAELVLVTLEDLFLEERPQNTPGTWRERPNWSRFTRYLFEEYCNDENVLYTFKNIASRRKEAKT
jgi:4-alpha-glucanotransferase